MSGVWCYDCVHGLPCATHAQQAAEASMWVTAHQGKQKITESEGAMPTKNPHGPAEGLTLEQVRAELEALPVTRVGLGEENPAPIVAMIPRGDVLDLLSRLSTSGAQPELLEAARYAATTWSSCSHYRGCLPGGCNSRPRDEWCASCRIHHAVDVVERAAPAASPTGEPEQCSAVEYLDGRCVLSRGHAMPHRFGEPAPDVAALVEATRKLIRAHAEVCPSKGECATLQETSAIVERAAEALRREP